MNKKKLREAWENKSWKGDIAIWRAQSTRHEGYIRHEICETRERASYESREARQHVRYKTRTAWEHVRHVI